MDRFMAPFPGGDIFRIIFAGRLDAFKDPSLMFETMRRLHEARGGRLEFRIGTSDPIASPNSPRSSRSRSDMASRIPMVSPRSCDSATPAC